MEKILIKNCAVLPMTGRSDYIEKGSICIELGRIKAVQAGEMTDPGWEPDRVIDGSGCVAIPGMVNCHTHAAMTLLRSYADDLPLMQWLSEKIWPLESNLTGDDVYWGSMLCSLEMIKSGTTTFADMYFFMDRVAEAVDHSGIRASLSRGMIGVGNNAELALQESRQLVKDWHGQAGGRITAMLGPHAPYTCPPDYLAKVINLASELGVGIHIHLAETRTEFDDISKQYGKTPTELLNDVGLFQLPVLAAHCVHLTERDITIIKEKGVRVAHNPESNMKLASGIAPVPQMLAAGITVGLGTDGAASNNNLDLLQEMRTAALLHKVNTGDPMVLPSYQALEMATINGARALRLEQEIGSIEPGKKADIVLVDFQQPHLYPKNDTSAHLVYAAQAADVKTVIIDGKLVMDNRQVLTIDQERVMYEVQKRAERLVAAAR